MLHVIPNRKLHKASFEMTYTAAMRMMGTSNSNNSFWSLAASLKVNGWYIMKSATDNRILSHVSAIIKRRSNVYRL